MATVLHGISTASTSNANSYASGSFTPAANDLLVVFVVASDTVDSAPTLTDSQGLGFSLYSSVVKRTSLDTIYCFVAVKLAAASAMTVTFGCPNDAATGATIEVARVSGMTRVGTGAIRQNAVQANQTSGTPAPAFGSAVLTGNPTLGVIGNGANPATMTPPASWTENDDTGYITPTSGTEYVSRDSGFTGTTVTWGSSSASAFGSMVIEMDTSAAASISTLTDDFATINGATWITNLNGGTASASGVLTMASAASSAFSGPNLTAATNYSMTGAALWANVQQVGNTGTDEDTSLYVVVGADFNNRLMWTQEQGTLKARKAIAGTFTDVATIPYNASNQAWWRIRESGGTIFWDYSADSQNWINLTSLANPFGITAMVPVLEVFEQTSTGSPGSAVFDKLNLTTTPAPYSPLRVSNKNVGPMALRQQFRQPYNPIQQSFDLGINWFPTNNGVLMDDTTANAQLDDIKAAGITKLRIGLPSFDAPSAITDVRHAVGLAVAKGFKVIYGITGGATLTSTTWTTYSTNAQTEATWAQSNGVAEFVLGNELEYTVDGTTLTTTTLRSNLRSLATTCKSLFTNGKLSYNTSRDWHTQWISEGLGNINLFGLNAYIGGTDAGPIFPNVTGSWQTDCALVYAAFGKNMYMSEWSLDYISLADFSGDESVQYTYIQWMLTWFQTSGIPTAYYFNYYDDSTYLGPPVNDPFGVRKANGQYRLWAPLLGFTLAPIIYYTTGATRIANKFVGPMALRHNFRQPYVPTSIVAAIAPFDPSVTSVWAQPVNQYMAHYRKTKIEDY